MEAKTVKLGAFLPRVDPHEDVISTDAKDQEEAEQLEGSDA